MPRIARHAEGYAYAAAHRFCQWIKAGMVCVDQPITMCNGGLGYPQRKSFDHMIGPKLFELGNLLRGTTRSKMKGGGDCPRPESWPELAHELLKCAVICHNCHADRTWGGRQASQ